TGPITHGEHEPLALRNNVRAERIVRIHQAVDAAIVVAETEIAFLDRAAGSFGAEGRPRKGANKYQPGQNPQRGAGGTLTPALSHPMGEGESSPILRKFEAVPCNGR